VIDSTDAFWSDSIPSNQFSSTKVSFALLMYAVDNLKLILMDLLLALSKFLSTDSTKFRISIAYSNNLILAFSSVSICPWSRVTLASENNLLQ